MSSINEDVLFVISYTVSIISGVTVGRIAMTSEYGLMLGVAAISLYLSGNLMGVAHERR